MKYVLLLIFMVGCSRPNYHRKNCYLDISGLIKCDIANVYSKSTYCKIGNTEVFHAPLYCEAEK